MSNLRKFYFVTNCQTQLQHISRRQKSQNIKNLYKWWWHKKIILCLWSWKWRKIFVNFLLHFVVSVILICNFRNFFFHLHHYPANNDRQKIFNFSFSLEKKECFWVKNFLTMKIFVCWKRPSICWREKNIFGRQKETHKKELFQLNHP